MATLYILQSETSGKFYVGSALDLQRRLGEQEERQSDGNEGQVLHVPLAFSPSTADLAVERKHDAEDQQVLCRRQPHCSGSAFTPAEEAAALSPRILKAML